MSICLSFFLSLQYRLWIKGRWCCNFGILLASTTKDLDILHTFYEHNGLAVNVIETKLMVLNMSNVKVSIQLLCYEEEENKVVHNFKYLAVDIPNQHTWDRCLNMTDLAELKTLNLWTYATLTNPNMEIKINSICMVQTLIYIERRFGVAIFQQT